MQKSKIKNQNLSIQTGQDGFYKIIAKPRTTIKLWYGAKRCPNFKKNSGYTMVEMVVVLSIVTLLGAVVLASFTGFNERGALNRSGRELALALRQAQNMSLAVTQIQTQAGSAIPPAVGVKLSLAQSQSFFTFADLVFDRRYNAAEDAMIGDTGRFERHVRIQNLTAYNPGPIAHTAVHVIFAAPEAVVFLTDADGIGIGNRLEIKLVAPSGQEKTITVRTSGQISIK